MSVNSLCNWAAIECIRGYRKWLSPRKGFSCPHRLMHGGQSCSGFVQNAIAQHGVKDALPLARQRFAECKAAGQTLRANHSHFAGPPPIVTASPFEAWWQRVKRRFDGCADCSGCDCNSNVFRAFDGCFDCGPGDSGCIDCTPCG